MRGDRRVRAGTFPYDGPDAVTGWHHHDLHQIEYAFRGVVEVETETAHHLLPPQQAVWIPAGLRHRTTLKGVRSVSVFFEAGMVAAVEARARILAAEPVIREMILYGVRWPIGRPRAMPRPTASSKRWPGSPSSGSITRPRSACRRAPTPTWPP